MQNVQLQELQIVFIQYAFVFKIILQVCICVFVCYTQDCDRMQQLCDLLEAYVNWKPVEKVFWTWMVS